MGFTGGSDGKESARNAGDLSLIPGSRRSTGEGTGIPFQYSSNQSSSVAQLCLILCDSMDAALQVSLSITNSWSLLKLMIYVCVYIYIYTHTHTRIHVYLMPYIYMYTHIFNAIYYICI